MRHAAVALALWLALSSATNAQTGGYPASPSHGIIGSSPDGTPRYGSEPGKAESRPSGTVGRSDTSQSADRQRASSSGGNGNESKPDNAGNTQR